jgi:hypothetical protein
MGNYKLSAEVLKPKCKKYDSAGNSSHRNQQSLTKDSTHVTPIIVNSLTSLDASKKNVNQKLKSSAQQNKGHKIVIISDSHA